MEFNQETVVKNVSQIRVNKGFSKRKMAELLSMDESNYGRLENGKFDLPYKRLVKIAAIFEMSVLDILTYPDVYRKFEPQESPLQEEYPEVVLQIKLKKDKRDKALNLIFGDNNLEVLMK